MERRTYLASVGSSVTALGVGLAGCGGGGGGADAPTSPGDGGGDTGGNGDTGGVDGDGGDTAVDMVTEGGDTYYFDPIGLYVDEGDTVTFSNESGSHSATAYHEENDGADATRIPDDAEAWDSGILSEGGATYEHTFETSGTHDYFCIPHKTQGMVGRIVVDEPGGPGEDGQPPDGELPSSQTIVDEGTVAYDDFTG